ncbi:hypothetical protein PBY51_015560 [Eleginops maclovinus]|uniref:Uncharacterized protein n=1 Tax=Eleginops maclovinus TaxID=56733 RepID=A0AAN8ARD9_ELEMC|nr:hypothetical protein PBY51_015560 [Eleginops maclovinus]
MHPGCYGRLSAAAVVRPLDRRQNKSAIHLPPRGKQDPRPAGGEAKRRATHINHSAGGGGGGMRDGVYLR